MSGIKTTYTTISDQELRRLRERAAKATNLQESNRLLNQLSAKNDAALAEYRNRINTMNSTISQLNQQLTQQGAAATKETQALRQQLQRTVRESNQRLQEAARQSEEQLRSMQKVFSEEISQTRKDMADAISANNRRIEAAVRQTSQHLEQEMQELQSQVSKNMAGIQSQLDSVEASVRASEQNQGVLLDMAREYMQTAKALLQDIENYRTELLCPGRLDQVQSACAAAESEIALAEKIPENSSAARGATRQALESALALRQDVIRAEQEWALHFQAARQMLNTAQMQLEASRTLSLPEEGEDASVDVDRWTDGDLKAIEGRLGALERQLDSADGLILKELDGLQAAGLQISREIDDTSVFALEAFFASQDRGEIAQDIANQLNAHGLTVVDHSYQGADQRAAHRLHLVNHVTKFEIVITQTPEVRDGAIVNRLESDILNYGSLNEERGDNIARDVLASLSELGFQQTAVTTAPGYEGTESNRQEFANIQQWRTEQATEIVKPVHAARESAGN